MTLAYDGVGKIVGDTQQISSYIVATSNDTTDPVNGRTIDNTDGKVRAVMFQVIVTDKTGTSPTLNVILQGSIDGTTFHNLLDSGGAAISTGALDISSADSTNVTDAENTENEAINYFPPYLRVIGDLGGTTPGWTGTISAAFVRG